MIGAALVPGCKSAPKLAVVDTSSGRLATFVTAQGCAFFDIPYAAPPRGPLRWREPEPIAGSTALLPLHRPQNVLDPEDCLRLDLFTPDVRAGPRFPLLVWFATHEDEPDGARLDGSTLAADGLVVAVVRARGGLLGSFAHGALERQRPGGPCNFGLLDRLAALDWLRRHAERFGGDASRLTLAGSRQGATDVLLLLASGATTCSAAILHEPAVFLVPPARGRTLEECGRLLPAATANDLRALPAGRLGQTPAAGALGLPIVDGTLVTGPLFQPWERGTVPPVPMLVGSSGPDAQLDAAAAARWLALRQAAQAPVYLCRFRYAPRRPGLRADAPALAWLPQPRPFGPDAEAADRQLAEIVRDYWSAFARTGVPASNAAVAWPPCRAGSDVTQILDATVASVPGWNGAELDRAGAALRSAAATTADSDD